MSFSGRCNEFLDPIISGQFVSIVRSLLLRRQSPTQVLAISGCFPLEWIRVFLARFNHCCIVRCLLLIFHVVVVAAVGVVVDLITSIRLKRRIYF